MAKEAKKDPTEMSVEQKLKTLKSFKKHMKN